MKWNTFTKSFSYAWRGIVYVFQNEQNFRIQSGIASLVVIAMFLFQLTRSEMVVVLLLVLLVLILELLNSALEKFIDLLKPRLHLHIGVVKDIMAAMVLLAGFGAILIGGIIFSPHMVELLRY